MAHINPVMDFRLKLEIGFKDSNKGIVIADEYGDITKGLDMDFDIIKSYENKPTPSHITIYNLSTETYNLIFEKANAFRLSCARGENAEYVPFYTGYPIRSTQLAKEIVLTTNKGFMEQDANAGRRGQNDLETVITLHNYGFAQLFKSYQAGISSAVVINDCITALGLPKGNMDGWAHVNLPTGFTIRGDVSNALTQLGNRLGFNWNTNDMKFNIYDKNKSDMKTYGIRLTPDNSATPERQDDLFKARVKDIQEKNETKDVTGVKANTKPKVAQGFMIKTQLLPYLQCGATCYMDFDIKDGRGEKYIYKIHHVGSNVGTECFSEIYCV